MDLFKMRIANLTLVMGLAATANSCTNSRLDFLTGSMKTSVTALPNSVESAYKIARVTVQTAGNGNTASGAPIVQIFMNSSASIGPITNSCTGASGTSSNSKPCLCLFQWNEVNQTGNESIAVPRQVTTAVTGAQGQSIQCAAPPVYDSEISDRTVVEVSIIGTGANTSQFNVDRYKFTKKQGSTDGAFQDENGMAFDNILRYSCYEEFQRGLSIQSKLQPIDGVQSVQNQRPAFVHATQFCTSTVSDSGAITSNCDATTPTPQAGYSSQSYYYNLFIRNAEKGKINVSNTRYKCPLVREGLDNSQNYWPLDSSFALAVDASSDFAVGVEAYSKLAVGQSDATTTPSSCFASQTGGTGNAAPGSLLKSCLGYAAKPKSDGSCPVYKDSDGNPLKTYRLRRFVTLYPPQYDATGKLINQPHASDTVYVVDRPVIGALPGDAEPTMLGPKPCPFAFYDTKGVTGTARYAGTPDAGWNGLDGKGTNVDGIEFPNIDSFMTSCSAAMPIFAAHGAGVPNFSIATVNARNPASSLKHVWIRPMPAWGPHYVEDTDFFACTPLSKSFRDPPLHFTKTAGGNVAYCAESYPTYNSYLVSGGFPGAPYTSHQSENSSSATCSSVAPSMSNACDRTVEYSTPPPWKKFPLLAPASDIETAMRSDSTYTCTVTFDKNFPGATSKVGKSTPTGGCCGANVSLTTGMGGAADAHLEPTAACIAPAY